MISEREIEQEIRRLEAAVGFHRLTWDQAKARIRILRWVLGIEPQSPLDHRMDKGPKRLESEVM